MWKTQRNRPFFAFFFHILWCKTVFLVGIIHNFCGKLPSLFSVSMWYIGIVNEVPAWKTSKKFGKKSNQNYRWPWKKCLYRNVFGNHNVFKVVNNYVYLIAPNRRQSKIDAFYLIVEPSWRILGRQTFVQNHHQGTSAEELAKSSYAINTPEKGLEVVTKRLNNSIP